MTTDKPIRRNAKGQFLVGSTGNLKGRPVGSRNKLAEGLLTDFAEDWHKHGKQSVKQLRQEDNTAYCKIAASLIPKETIAKILSANIDLAGEDGKDLFAAAYDLALQLQAPITIEHDNGGQDQEV